MMRTVGGAVRYGLCKGSADLIGFVSRPGRGLCSRSADHCCCSANDADLVAQFLSIEVKRPGCKPTIQQLAWGRMVTEMGGIHIVATSVADVEQALQ